MTSSSPAVSCLDYAPHKGVGEVAARARRIWTNVNRCLHLPKCFVLLCAKLTEDIQSTLQQKCPFFASTVLPSQHTVAKTLNNILKKYALLDGNGDVNHTVCRHTAVATVHIGKSIE